MKHQLSIVLGAAALGAAMSGQALAEYPDKPITMMVGFAAGGGTDTVGRAVAARMAELLHQPIVIENRPGGGGALASQQLARAKPDGYTIMMSSIGPLSINQHLGSPLGYDPAKDFSFISMSVAFPIVIVVNPKTGFKTVDDMVAAIRKKDSKISYGSSGVGGAGHLAGALFNETLHIDNFPHVPFRGGAPALNDLLGNNIPVVFSSIGETLPHIAAGRLTPLAVTSLKRSPALPNVPTLDEWGLKGYEMINWYGLIAPAGTPPDVIAKLNQAAVESLKDPKVAKFLVDSAMTPFPTSPKEMQDFVNRETEKWGKVIKDGGIRGE